MARAIPVLPFVKARQRQLRAFARFRAYGAGAQKVSSAVSCRACSACCRTFDVPLEPRESVDGLAVREADGMRWLKRREDGACVHLGAAGCTVHDKRPAACRVYDCRDLAVVGVRTDNQPLVNAAADQWSVAPVTKIERNVLAKLREVVGQRIAAGDGAIASTRAALETVEV